MNADLQAVIDNGPIMSEHTRRYKRNMLVLATIAFILAVDQTTDLKDLEAFGLAPKEWILKVGFAAIIAYNTYLTFYGAWQDWRSWWEKVGSVIQDRKNLDLTDQYTEEAWRSDHPKDQTGVYWRGSVFVCARHGNAGSLNNIVHSWTKGQHSLLGAKVRELIWIDLTVPSVILMAATGVYLYRLFSN